MTRLRAGWLVAVVVLAATPALADSFTIGSGTGGGFVRPFGCGADGCLGESQEVYAATAFGGPITITQIGFESAPNQPATSVAATFTLGLSTTTATPSTLNTTYALNRGPDFTNVFAGTITDTAVSGGTFDLVIPLVAPFTYNPASGNLLVDVNTIAVTVSGPLNTVGFLAGASPDTGWVYDFFNGATLPPISRPDFGLLTQFTSSAAETPEPASVTLLAAGLALTALRRRRK